MNELTDFLESPEFQKESNKVSPRPLATVAREAGIKYNSLVRAAQQGRIRAWKDGKVWMTSLDALELARSIGKIRKIKMYRYIVYTSSEGGDEEFPYELPEGASWKWIDDVGGGRFDMGMGDNFPGGFIQIIFGIYQLALFPDGKGQW